MYLSYNTNGYILRYIPFRDLFKLYILNTLFTIILLISKSWLLKIKLNFSVLFMAEKWGTTEIISLKNLFLSSWTGILWLYHLTKPCPNYLPICVYLKCFRKLAIRKIFMSSLFSPVRKINLFKTWNVSPGSFTHMSVGFCTSVSQSGVKF